MRNGRGRGRKSGWTKPQPAPVARRRWSWKIDGIDVRPALLFIIPLGVLCGAILAPSRARDVGDGIQMPWDFRRR